MADFVEYAQYDGLGLADLVRRKEVTPGELVEEAIRRIERLNPQLNAVIHKMYELGRETAVSPPNGPFCGVPFLLKDLIALYAGTPTRNGSRFFNDFIPDYDSEIVRRYKAAGLIILGKSNTPEFGLEAVTEPELFGPSLNPWDATRTTGGSSGGSAGAVASGMVPLAHASDGAGSIRIPASCCGLFGMKPTRGRNPLGPYFGEFWHGLAVEHVLTRSVRDSAAVLDATVGPDVGAPYYAPRPVRPFLDEVGTDPGVLRIAFTTRPFLGDEVHEDCVKGVEETAVLLQNLGHEVVEDTPLIDGQVFIRAFLTMVCGQVRASMNEGERLLSRKARYRDYEPATWVLGLLAKQFTAAEFSEALGILHYSARQIGPFFEKYDVLLTPTLAQPPVKTGALRTRGLDAWAMRFFGRLHAGWVIRVSTRSNAIAEEVFRFIPYTTLFNATGQPAMSVPLYWNEAGLPIGMQFVGRFGDEATLFRLAGQLEQAKPWFGRRPAVC